MHKRRLSLSELPYNTDMQHSTWVKPYRLPAATISTSTSLLRDPIDISFTAFKSSDPYLDFIFLFIFIFTSSYSGFIWSLYTLDMEIKEKSYTCFMNLTYSKCLKGW